MNMNIPSDLMNIANEISQQIEQNGINICPDATNAQQFTSEINNVQRNISNGLDMMNKVNELYEKFDRDSDGAITQNGLFF
jgi:Ca2+-binding EF-hand superfamily protein